MQSVLRMALVDPCNESREHLKQLLADLDPVWVEAECPHYDDFGDIIEQTSPDISVIALDSDPERALEVVTETARACPTGRVIVTSNDTDSNRILQAMRCGANEYLTLPIDINDLLPALDRVRKSRAQDPDNAPGNSTIVSVTGAVGGVGSTSIAVNLACQLASNPGNRVVLVDLDMVLGDADVCLDIVHSYTLLDVVENINRLDFTLLKRSLVQHSSGVFFLPHPNNLEEVSRIHPESLRRFIGLLKATFTHVVLDLSNGFRETDVAAMDSSDIILLLSQLNVSSVRNVSRVLKALEGAESILERVRIVLNRVGTRDQTIPVEKAEEIIGQKIFWSIPNDWNSIHEARNKGLPLIQYAPKSKVTYSIADLAAEISGDNGSEQTKSSRKKWNIFSFGN